jgi:xanthine dehydrogenase YagS FAD-binding subunit
MIPFEYLVADRVDAALSEYAGEGVTLKAGGIDVLDLMKEHVNTPKTVLSIDGLSELRYIRQEQDGVHIGSGTTLADMGRNDLLATKYQVLHQSAAHAATPQIRERATIAGNLCQRPRCWYFRNVEFHCLKKGGHICFAVDGENRYHAIFGGGPCHIVHPSNVAPALVALDAALVIRSATAPDERIQASDFFKLPHESLYAENILKPGQIITEIVLPRAPTASATIELREKQSFDWPMVICAVARMEKEWRVCLGAVAPIPWLSRTAMRVLGNRDISLELAAAAGDSAADGAESLPDNEYKVSLVKVATKRALLAASGMEVP